MRARQVKRVAFSCKLLISRIRSFPFLLPTGASPGEICYGDSQCHLNDENAFCDFVVRGVFGLCTCLHGRDADDPNKCSERVKGKKRKSIISDATDFLLHSFQHWTLLACCQALVRASPILCACQKRLEWPRVDARRAFIRPRMARRVSRFPLSSNWFDSAPTEPSSFSALRPLRPTHPYLWATSANTTRSVAIPTRTQSASRAFATALRFSPSEIAAIVPSCSAGEIDRPRVSSGFAPVAVTTE